jgi:plasmid stability protein
MAQILVRDLDEKVVKRLKARASENGRSLQQEVKAALEELARQRLGRERRAVLDELRRRFTGRSFPDAVELIREDRDR